MSKAPLETIANRVADILPGIKAAQAGVMLEDLRATQKAHRQRTQDGHKAMAKAAGVKIDKADAEDDMGDIVITGDITMTQPAPPVEPPQPPPPPLPSSQPKPKRSSLLKSVAIAAALSGMGGGIGVTVPWLLGMFDKTPVAAPADEWTERRLENYVPPGSSP